MSYDIYLTDPKTGDVLHLDDAHDLKGGTFAVGGTTEAWLDVTYNYGKHFYPLLGDKGIRVIYGMTGQQSIPILEEAAAKLGDDVSDDYWEPTEGNVKRALTNLLTLAKAAPHGVWKGD